MRLLICKTLLLVTLLAALGASPAAAEDEKEGKDLTGQELVDRAKITFEGFMNDDSMSWVRNKMPQARGVFIIPRYLRAGFIFGGMGGSGVYLARDPETGEWSYPAFYASGGASFGLQAGADSAEIVIVAMTKRGAEAFLRTKVSLGSDVTVTAGPVGAGASANLLADLIAVSRTKGVFGGVSAEGTVVTPRDAVAKDYYGKPVSASDILVKRTVENKNADALVAAVSSAAAPTPKE